MPSERIQRRVDRLLDEAEAAADRKDWPGAAEIAREVLELDPANEDAPALLRAAEAMLGPQAALEGAPVPTPDARTAEQPSSFVAGRYAVRRFLGEGGKKRVYLAHDERLDRDVAFALIKTEGLDEVGRQRITREAQAMGRLGAHPHVVTIFEIGDEASAPYVVTELLGGGDVEGLLAEGTLPLARTLEIAKGVARGLAFAHQQGVVHRDLKPGNVWLTSSGPEGVAKIGDFGLAVALDRSRLTTHGLMVGTVAYMPPEQALGGEVTPQADLYSLGAMLYELVTGKPPFAGDNPTAIISQHINTPPVAPSWHSEHCPPDLEALILKLLAKVPADRPASALEVLAALEAVDPEAPSVRHSDSSANPLDRLARGVFVGRERELERLKSAFDEAFAGRGSVVMLVGEPGIGKTRTVQELSTYARMRGAKVLWGRAHEASGAPPYWPWTQVARAYRDQTPDEVRRAQYEPYAVDLQRIFPNLRTLFPNLPEPPPVDSEEAQFQLFDALSSFFRAVSVETPLVLVLDDLHWADRSTLRMLTHLAREVGMSRLLVTGTYRDTDLDRAHPLSQALAELNREDLFTRILLRGLTESETAAYIRDTAQSEPPADLVRRVHAETEGNPFFLSEVVRLMAEERAFSGAATSEIRIPEGVKEALGRRLDRLSPEANELLSVAAVVGRECTHALLSALTDFDDDTLLALIEEALRARVLEETGAPGEYRFTHALMQDALYSELSTARRVRMHGRVAEALEVLYASGLDREAAQLARHFGEASVMNRSLAEKAVHYSRLAAEQAAAALAWEEAIRQYDRCLALVTDASDDLGQDEAGLWAALALCLKGTGASYTTSRAALDRALALYRAHGDARGAAAAAVPFFLSFQGAAGAREEWATFDALISALGNEDSAELCGLLAARASYDFSLSGNASADRAQAMAARLGLTGTAFPSRLTIREAHVAMERDEFKQAAAMMDAFAAEVDRRPARGDANLTARTWRTHALLMSGDIDAAVASLTDHQEAQWRFRRLSGMASGSAGLAQIAWQRGETDRYAALIMEGEGLSAVTNLSAARVALDRGRLDESLALLPGADHPNITEVSRRGALALRSTILLAAGERDAASAELRRSLETWQADPFVDRWLTLGSAGAAILEFAEDSLIREISEFLARYAKARSLVTYTLWVGSADDLRGRLAHRLGDPEAAERHYTEGLEWARRPDVRFGLVEGRCLQGLADIAEARGDHSAAMQHLDAAAALFAENGAKLYLDQVLAKKQILKA